MAGGLLVFVTGITVREFGGGKFAIILASLAVIFAPNLLFAANYLSMNIFDVLLWTLSFYILVKIIKSGNTKLWLIFGIITGIGLQNKHSIIFLAYGLFVGLVLTSNRKYFTDKFLWLGILITFINFLPNIIWEFNYGWPTAEFIYNATRYKNVHFSPLDFFLAHLIEMNPGSVLLLIGALYFFFFNKDGKEFRLFGWIYLSILLLFGLTAAKPYYIATIFPLIFVAGASSIEKIIENYLRPWIKPALILFLLPGYILIAPFALPILPVETYIKYSQFIGISPTSSERHEMGPLPQHFADMFGWENMVKTVAKVYESLPDEDKEKVLIFGQNYGEAGAINFLGRKYNLPAAVSSHNNYWIWGVPENYTGEVMIVIGSSKEDNEEFFESVEEAAVIINKYAMPYETNLPVFICRGLKEPISKIWPRLKSFG